MNNNLRLFTSFEMISIKLSTRSRGLSLAKFIFLAKSMAVWKILAVMRTVWKTFWTRTFLGSSRLERIRSPFISTSSGLRFSLSLMSLIKLRLTGWAVRALVGEADLKLRREILWEKWKRIEKKEMGNEKEMEKEMEKDLPLFNK